MTITMLSMVNKVTDIPMGFAGAIGVPITFLDKYNPGTI